LIEKVRYYASVGLSIKDICTVLDRSDNTVTGIMRRHKIHTNKREEEFCSINDKELDRRCHKYALSLGIDNSCKTIKASKAEVAKYFANIKPMEKENYLAKRIFTINQMQM
jgi:IS30 family transposase